MCDNFNVAANPGACDIVYYNMSVVTIVTKLTHASDKH